MLGHLAELDKCAYIFNDYFQYIRSVPVSHELANLPFAFQSELLWQLDSAEFRGIKPQMYIEDLL